jgi:hypothetical protein
VAIGHDGVPVGNNGEAEEREGALVFAAEAGWTIGARTTGKAGGRIWGKD